jgi:L-iditol 2-dehydrogenase
MKGLVAAAKAKDSLEIRDIPEPRPGTGEVKVAVRFAGICGTDVKIYHGDYPYVIPPVAIGHEFSGVVVETGPGVKTLKQGDRVTGLPVGRWCGTCLACLKGEFMYCPEATIAGIRTHGGFASFAILTEALTFQLPDSVSLESAAMLEPLCVSLRGAVEMAQVALGDRVVISGPGPIGLLALMICRAAGAKCIVLGTDEDTERLKRAGEIGADHIINVSKRDPAPIVNDLTGGEGADVVLECAGAGVSVDQCFTLANRGGKFGQIGTTVHPMTVDFMRIAYKELKVYGSYGSSLETWRRALRVLEMGKIQPDRIASHAFPLSQWRKAFGLLEGREGIKILLYPD